MKLGSIGFRHSYEVVCRSADGAVKWIERGHNLVPTQMLNSILNGVGYSATFYVGLVDNAGFSAYAAGDTAASHAGWTENTDYVETVRQTLTRSTSTAASWNNTGNEAVFNMNASVTIRGFFIQSSNVKGGTAGVLGGEVDFSGGSHAVIPGDSLTISISGTAASV